MHKLFVSLITKIKIKIIINIFLEKIIIKIQCSIPEIQHGYKRVTIPNMILFLFFSFSRIKHDIYCNNGSNSFLELNVLQMNENTPFNVVN